MTVVKKTVSVSKSEIDWIKTEMLIQKDIVNKIHQTIVGDKTFGQVGLIEKVNNHEKFMEESVKTRSKFIGGIAVIGVGWTLLIKFWDNIFH
jgi:hypothetical protein